MKYFCNNLFVIVQSVTAQLGLKVFVLKNGKYAIILSDEVICKMEYVSLVHALNLPCKLDTCGDWHTSALQWEKPNILKTEDSIFGDYGIEKK